MTESAVPTKTVIGLAASAVIAAVALALQPWVDLRDVGGPGYWNGLGMFAGPKEYGDLGSLSNPLGWVVAASMALAAAALVSSTRTLPWLRWVASGFAAVAVATVVACLIRPSLLAGDLLHEFGADSIPARDVVNSPVLWGELVVTGLALLTPFVITVAERRTPRAA
jgi:hypothetical protein